MIVLLSQPWNGDFMQKSTPQEGVTALTDDAERNRLLAEMAENSTDMISRHTPGDWRFIYASPAVTHLLGFSVEEIIGVSAHELYHPDDVEDFTQRAASVSYERGTYTHTYRFRCKDGHYTWLESTSRSIRDPDSGELQEILVVSRDASRRIEAEQANRRLARVLEISNDLVIFLSPQLGITHLNASACRTLAVGQRPVAALSLADLFPADSLARFVEQGLPAATRQGSWTGELEMQGTQGEVIPVSLELLAHTALHGEVEYLSVVARDLSAARAADLKLKQYQAEMDHAARLVTMGELASSLAHELNQPLTAIVNYVRGIQRRLQVSPTLSREELQFPLDKTAATALRAGEMIHRMMDFTRKGEPLREALAFSEVVSDVLQLCAPNAERHQVQLLERVAPTLPAVVADRIQLEQVLLNLIVNAIEACAGVDGGSGNAPQVSVGADVVPGGMLQVFVRDQGCGLSTDNPQRVFERFFTTKAKGLGMGLAISRSLVETLGGQLWAENNPDAGACFWFTLPLAEAS